MFHACPPASLLPDESISQTPSENLPHAGAGNTHKTGHDSDSERIWNDQPSRKHSFLPRLRDGCGRVGKSSTKARGGGWRQESSIFWAQQSSCTHGLTAVMTAFTTPRPVQAQAWPNLGWIREWTQSPTLS